MTDAAVVDLRTYRLVPGDRDEFDRIFREEALPMPQARGIDVVGYGPSLLDDRHYSLTRRFPSEAERARALDAFYGSPEWLEKYPGIVTTLVESSHHLVVPE